MIGILYTILFMAAGLFLADRAFRREGVLERLALGLSMGLFLLMWLPALAAFPLGFGVAAQIAALAVCLLAAAAVFVFGKHRVDWRGFCRGLLKERAAWAVVLPLLGLICYLLYSHILRPDESGNLWAGQSTFGDMSLHAGLMTSVAEQGMFPPDYSLLAGRVAVGYPFLCNTVSATLLVLGTGLRAAYITPMALAALSVLLGGFVFLRAFLRKTGPAVLAAVIFFIGGGFGFAYIFDLMKQNPGQLAEMMDAFYRTPMNNVEAGVRWVNVIADMLIPQRATLFGWAILFPCLYLLIRAADGERRLFIPLGILAGGLPLIHTHSFLALGILSAVCVVFALIDARGKLAPIRGYLLFGGIALALAAPQLLLFTFAQASEGEFLRLGFNWANELDNYFWFYIKNMGLLFILMIPAFLHADRRKKRFFLGGALIWLICEFVLFQPNPYDNNKLLFIWFLLLCGIVADWLMDAWGALRAAKIRGVWAVAALTVAVLNLSGVMTLAREVVSEYQLFSRNHVEAASFIREGTAKDALFLTADNHNNAVAALSGRNIVCGSGVFLHYHGLDYVPAWQANHRMLTSPKREELLEYGVNYVYIGDYERGVEGVDLEFFERAFPIVYQNDAITIYKVQ